MSEGDLTFSLIEKPCEKKQQSIYIVLLRQNLSPVINIVKTNLLLKRKLRHFKTIIFMHEFKTF